MKEDEVEIALLYQAVSVVIAGKNGREYKSLGNELVKDKKLKKDGVSLSAIREWARAHPDEIEAYLNRNESFVFFTPIDGNTRGSLNVPVTAMRTRLLARKEG